MISLGQKSVLSKTVLMQGAKVSFTITLHKATKFKEMEQTTVITKVLGPILRPYDAQGKQQSSPKLLLNPGNQKLE